MSPPDRKVVHDAVNDIAGVATSSEGEDPRRYVVIRPVARATNGVDDEIEDVETVQSGESAELAEPAGEASGERSDEDDPVEG